MSTIRHSALLFGEEPSAAVGASITSLGTPVFFRAGAIPLAFDGRPILYADRWTLEMREFVLFTTAAREVVYLFDIFGVVPAEWAYPFDIYNLVAKEAAYLFDIFNLAALEIAYPWGFVIIVALLMGYKFDIAPAASIETAYTFGIEGPGRDWTVRKTKRTSRVLIER